jgi:peroxiredoxin
MAPEAGSTMHTPLWKAMYGRKHWGALRATVVIDGDGVLAHVIPKVTPKTYDEEVLGVAGAVGGVATR